MSINTSFKKELLMKVLLVLLGLSIGNVFASECSELYFSFDFESAFDVCRQNVDSDLSGETALILGSMYKYGRGLNRNTDIAISWYEKSAKFGNTTAMYELRGIYTDYCHYGNPRCDRIKEAYWGSKSNPNQFGSSAFISTEAQNSKNAFKYSLAGVR